MPYLGTVSSRHFSVNVTYSNPAENTRFTAVEFQLMFQPISRQWIYYFNTRCRASVAWTPILLSLLPGRQCVWPSSSNK